VPIRWLLLAKTSLGRFEIDFPPPPPLLYSDFSRRKLVLPSGYLPRLILAPSFLLLLNPEFPNDLVKELPRLSP